MKKIILLTSATIFFLFNGIAQNKSDNNEKHQFSEGITFTIDKIKESKFFDGFLGGNIAGKRNKYISITMTFENTSGKKQEIDLDEIALYTPENKSFYELDGVKYVGPFSAGIYFLLKLPNKKNRKRELIYLFPQHKKASHILINGDLIELNY